MTTATTIEPVAPVAPGPRSGRTERVGLALIGGVVLLTLALAWWGRWTADDAFINFRVVRNVLDGAGPVFNSGERVEVATSPLWLWLLVGLTAVLPFDVTWISVVLGAAGSATGIALACRGAMWSHRPRDGRTQLFLPVGALVFLAVPGTWAFLTSGLETGLTFAWLGAVWWGTARVATAPAPTRPWWLLVLLGLGPLVRPDLALVSGVLGLWLLVAVPSTWLRRVRDVAVAIALPLAYQVFRMGYYGLLVPNTAVAKESNRELWSRGWSYLADLVEPYDLYVAAGLCAVLLVLVGRQVRWPRRVFSLVVVTLLAAVLQALFVIRVGGDFMHARLLLPALFQCLCPLAMVPVAARVPSRRAWEQWTAVLVLTGLVVWGAVCAFTLRIDYPGGLGPRGISDERGFYAADASTPKPVELRDHGRGRVTAWGPQIARSSRAGANQVFAQNVLAGKPPDARLLSLGEAEGTHLLVFQAGYLGYAVPDEVAVFDFFGLADPLGGHLEPAAPGRAGHEKVVPIVWFWARHSDGFPERQSPDPALGRVTRQGLAAARAALRCGDLAELIAATNEPLTWDRFWANLTGSAGRTSMRVPTDPVDARDVFC